jgi:hypothetical protein
LRNTFEPDSHSFLGLDVDTLEASARHCDGKYQPEPGGQIVRLHILVRKATSVGLGGEGAKLAASLLLTMSIQLITKA